MDNDVEQGRNERDMMVKYEQATRLKGVHYDVRGTNMVEAQRMEAQGAHVIKLNVGNVAAFGFRTPESMVRSVVTHMPECEGYSDARGIYSARTAVMNFYQAAGLDVDIDQVWLGNGVSELISMVLQALVNPGDEILVPAPDYPLWTAQVTLTGGQAVHYLCDEEDGWEPDLVDLESKVTERTRAIVLINPNNPTGAVYSHQKLQRIVDIARQHNLILLSDEIYEKVIYSGTFEHTASLAGSDILTLTFSGLSKAYRACGYRAGWLVVTGPLDQAESLLEGITLLANMRMCSNVFGQHAIQTALGGYQSIDDLVRPGGRFYDQLMFAHEELVKIPGVTCQPAKGALYLFPKLDPQMYPITDDDAWALDLLRRKRLLVSHGTGFNWPRPDHFRLVALPKEHELGEAVNRLRSYLAETRVG